MFCYSTDRGQRNKIRRKAIKSKPFVIEQVLTPKGHLQGEAHHSPCRQIQAASLI